MHRRGATLFVVVLFVLLLAACGSEVAPGAVDGATPADTGSGLSCPTDRDAERLVTAWDAALASRGTSGHLDQVRALAVVRAQLASNTEECSEAGEAELESLGLQVELLESALVTNGEADSEQYVAVATSGNEWLEAIGVEGGTSFALAAPQPPQETSDANVAVFTACSDRYPDSEFYVDFGVSVEGDSTTLLSAYVDARWPEGDAAPIYFLMLETASGETELLSAVAAEHTFDIPAEWSDAATHEYTVWIGEPRYGSADFADASPRAADEPVTCEAPDS